jgi:hypothetical protein
VVRDLVLEYYFHLRSALRQKPHLRPYLVRCRHCGIFFFTHPRNRGRKDLGCPFGCRAAHRKKRSSERSAAYYQTETGKQKKKQQNGKRRVTPSGEKKSEEKAARDKQEESRETKRGAALSENNSTAAEEEFDEAVVEHIQVMTTVLEERAVSREEVLDLLNRLVRQHSLASERRLDYVVRFLKENPP